MTGQAAPVLRGAVCRNATARISRPPAGLRRMTPRRILAEYTRHCDKHPGSTAAPKTVKKNQNVLEPILKGIGARKLRELTAADVRQALSTMATRYSSAAGDDG